MRSRTGESPHREVLDITAEFFALGLEGDELGFGALEFEHQHVEVGLGTPHCIGGPIGPIPGRLNLLRGTTGRVVWTLGLRGQRPQKSGAHCDHCGNPRRALREGLLESIGLVEVRYSAERGPTRVPRGWVSHGSSVVTSGST